MMPNLKYQDPWGLWKEKEKERREWFRNLFAEFAKEDVEMAEMGMDEYNKILLIEDKE